MTPRRMWGRAPAGRRYALVWTLAGAGGLVAATVAAAFAVEAAALPRPPQGGRVGAEVVAWLWRSPLVVGTVRIGGGRPERTRCVHGLVPLDGGRTQVDVLELGAQRLVLTNDGLFWRDPPRKPEPYLGLVELEAGACAGALAMRIGQRLQTGTSLRVRIGAFDGRRALAVSVPLRFERLLVYVEPRTRRPFAVAVWTRSREPLHAVGVFGVRALPVRRVQQLLSAARLPIRDG